MSDIWDYGGYVPFAYKVTPWATLFPDLEKVPVKGSLKNSNLARAFTFYLTRVEFCQYLAFLSNVGGDVCGNNSIAEDYAFYKDACNQLLNKISGDVSGQMAFSDIVSKFNKQLAESEDFYSIKVYNTFFKNYTYFKESSYGFIYSLASKYSAAKNDQLVFNNVPKPFSIMPMLKDAIRHYPVIKQENDECSLMLCHYTPSGLWSSIKFEFDYPSATEGTFPHAFEYVYPNEKSMRFYKVGQKQVPKFFEGPIRGMPMLQELPFDVVAALADSGPAE